MSSGFTPTLLALPSLAPALALEVLPRGLTLHRLFVQADGRTHDVLVGPERPDDHARMPYTNSIIGRYTNRIPTGAHTITSPRHPGLSGTLTAQPNAPGANPATSLHGGPDAWDKRVWETLTPDAATLFTPAEQATIRALPAAQLFALESPAGDGGYPGAVYTEVLVALLSSAPPSSSDTPRSPVATEGVYKLGSVLLVYRARLKSGEQVLTPINLTQHWGFNLDASLRRTGPEPDVKEHVLKMKADATIVLDDAANSAGALAPVAGTHHDHAQGKPLGSGWPASGYDEFYVFPKPTSATSSGSVLPADYNDGANFLEETLGEHQKAEDEPVCALSSKRSGIGLEFWTNQSGVQFYSANFYTRATNARKKIHGGSGVFGEGYDAGAGAFLEFHEPLGAFLASNADTVRGGWDTVLGPGDVYNNWVRMDVTYERPARDADAQSI